MGKPCLPMHPEPVADCPVCWRAEHSRAHQRLWGLPETGASADARAAPRFTTATPTRTALPCVHLGSPVRGEAAPDLSRDYRRCGHPNRPLGEVVCPCLGCGPACSGYAAE